MIFVSGIRDFTMLSYINRPFTYLLTYKKHVTIILARKRLRMTTLLPCDYTVSVKCFLLSTRHLFVLCLGLWRMFRDIGNVERVTVSCCRACLSTCDRRGRSDHAHVLVSWTWSPSAAPLQTDRRPLKQQLVNSRLTGPFCLRELLIFISGPDLLLPVVTLESY